MNTTFDSALINDLKNHLKSLPKKRITLEHVISQLEPIITDAINNKNYTHDDICNLLLEKKKISIKPTTLKSYLQKAKPKPELKSKTEV